MKTTFYFITFYSRKYILAARADGWSGGKMTQCNSISKPDLRIVVSRWVCGHASTCGQCPYFPYQLRGKSSVKMRNLFLKNVGPVIIVAVVCRLTDCRPRGNPMFRHVAVLFTIYNTSQRLRQWPSLVRSDLVINWTLGFCTRFLCFSPIKNVLGRTEMRTRERKEWRPIRTVWDISRDDRARTAAYRNTSGNCADAV